MGFEWDETKNQANILKHKVSFDEASLIFDGTVFSYEDVRKNYGETRYVSIGAVQNMVIIVVVHTPRNENRRIISARLANKEEREHYDNHTKEADQGA